MDTFEKKYNEALEQAKKELAACGSMDCDAARLIFRLFPQLHESEDERIRKVIYKLMLGLRKEIFTTADKSVTKEKVLAWLERQKEQKPAEWSEDFIDEVWTYLNAYRNLLDGTDKQEIANSIWKACDKLKSLRPVKQEWTEEDEMLMDELESYILYDKEFNDEQKSWRIKRLKSLRPSWKPSEEQMAWLKLAVDEANEPLKSQLAELYKDIRENLIWK